MSLLADIRVPQISSDELSAFHVSHFAKVAVAAFGVSFIGLQVPPAPVLADLDQDQDHVDNDGEEYEYYGDEEDYGDYDEPLDPSVAHLVPDFASMEEVDVIKEKSTTINTEKSMTIDIDDDAEDGEIPDEGDGLKPKKKKRRRKKNGAGNKPRESHAAGESHADTAKQKPDTHTRHDRNDRQGRPHKPDLRKRTWDVVDKGLGSLDYDDNEADPGSMPAPPQRRRIQYDD